jgi:hypothetical protein
VRLAWQESEFTGVEGDASEIRGQGDRTQSGKNGTLHRR